ncbi:MAG: asparagine synthase-related protein [Chloroflexota bacterium]
MSGVFGLAAHEISEPALSVAERMGASLCHQPYQRLAIGRLADRVALGHVGLGILNQTAQPVVSVDNQVGLCLCGEFYHQTALRRLLVGEGALAPDADDADLALQVFLRDGAEGLTRLEGAFTIAVWDKRRAELCLVNDRFGLYPHFFAHAGGCLAFAPEMKGVLCAPGVSRRLNLTAVAEYVRFQQLLGDKTWCEDILLLPPASLLRYQARADQLHLTRYWDWHEIGSQAAITFEEATEEVIRLFQRAIDLMSAPPQRVGVYLSGGLDSRTILGFGRDRVPVTTITYGAPGCRDVIYADEVARRAGSAHHWFSLVDGKWVLEHAPLHLALTDGMHSWIHAHGISTLSAARQLIDINLTGWRPSNLMHGSPVDRPYLRQSNEVALTQHLYDAFCHRLAWPGLTEAEAAALLGGRGDARLRNLAFDSLRAEVLKTKHYPTDRRAHYFIVQQHDRRSTQNLVVCARSAFEVRCPYFDYSLADFYWSLPASLRDPPYLRRAIITKRMPHLATVPYDVDDRLPHQNPLVYHSHATFQRGKSWISRHLWPIFPSRPRLYADYENYLRTDLRAWAEGLLFDGRAQDRGLFDPHALRALWERHLGGKELWTIGKIAPLMTIEMVLRALLEEEESFPLSAGQYAGDA